MRLDVEFDKSPCCDERLLEWRKVSTSDGAYTVQRCEFCKTGYINPRPDLENIFKYYEEGYSGHSVLAKSEKTVLEEEHLEPNATKDAKRIISKLKKIKTSEKSKNFLDVASGYGFFSKEAQDAGYDVTAIELAPNRIEICERILGKKVLQVSFEDFESKQKYDVILLSQILEHAVFPKDWLMKCSQLQDAGGELIIALPNFKSIFSIIMKTNDVFMIPPEHLNFFVKGGLSALLKKANYEVISIETTSRIPKSTFTKRFGIFGNIAYFLSLPLLKIFDMLDLGAFLTVHALKDDGNVHQR